MSDRTHVWEVRHAGLLGIKYEVAVRSDLVQTLDVKAESDDIEHNNHAILRDVVDAAVLGFVVTTFQFEWSADFSLCKT
jgi:TATA-binding protein-associated factor